MLKSCYDTCLKLAMEYNIKTIVFPSISTGAYRFPFDKAAVIAYNTISNFVAENPFPENVYLTCFSERDVENYKRALSKLML